MVGDAWQREQGPVEVRVMEEASEVIKACSKAIRFGWTSTNPLTGTSYDNRAHAAEEMADFMRVWDEMALKEGLPRYALVTPGVKA